ARTTMSVALSIAAFAVPVIGYLAWRWATFHALLPNTAMAKAQTTPSVAHVHRGIELIGYAGWPLVLIFAGCVGAVLVRPSPSRRALVVLAIPLGLAAFAYIVLVRDWMGALRFATPVWPVAALTAAIAFEAIARRTTVRGRAVLAACTVVACALTALTWQKDIARFSRGPTVPLCVVADQSRTYNTYARILGGRDASILLPDIGGTALTSRLRVVDLAGLADRQLAEYWSDRDMAGLRDHVFGRLRPTVIHVHGGWSTRTGLLADPRMATDYAVVHQYSSTGADLVRRDAVDRSRTLTELRAAAHRSAIRQAELGAAPRRSCGSTLR
ncbi:MAG TPA: hypothetical protein VNP92_20335, partial [Actinophytocola sp.]|nr:hypothetical protein [Actinophytocola sp.]